MDAELGPVVKFHVVSEVSADAFVKEAHSMIATAELIASIFFIFIFIFLSYSVCRGTPKNKVKFYSSILPRYG